METFENYMKNNPNAFNFTLVVCRANELDTINKFDFNRTIIKASVNRLIKSVSNNGIIRFPILIHTDKLSGKKEYYCIDGQHLLAAARASSNDVPCILLKEDKKVSDLISFISLLNSTAKQWAHKDYLNAFTIDKRKEYVILKRKLTKYNAFSIADSLHIYSTTGKREFKEGLMKLGDIKMGDNMADCLLDIFPLIGGKFSRFIQGYISWRKKTDNYDHKLLMTRIKLSKYNEMFVGGETPGSVASKLEYIYTS